VARIDVRDRTFIRRNPKTKAQIKPFEFNQSMLPIAKSKACGPRQRIYIEKKDKKSLFSQPNLIGKMLLRVSNA